MLLSVNRCQTCLLVSLTQQRTTMQKHSLRNSWKRPVDLRLYHNLPWLKWILHYQINLFQPSVAFHTETSYLLWQQTKWLVSIWNATQRWNRLNLLYIRTNQTLMMLNVLVFWRFTYSLKMLLCFCFFLKHSNLSMAKIILKYRAWTEEEYNVM